MKKYEVYMNQLTPNAIVRLSVFIWVVRSQGIHTDAEAFCRVHELHYHMKARLSYKLHNNFNCYNFAYQKDSVVPVLAYRTKLHSNWTKEWFYVQVDSKE